METNTKNQALYALRQALRACGVDGCLLPVTDEYQGEYSAEYARRVTWLCGFDGSAGMLIVLPDRAALLVDGRYTLQAKREVDANLYEVFDSATLSAGAFLRQYAASGARIGYDPWLHSVSGLERLEGALRRESNTSGAKTDDTSITLHALECNPIDALWHDQPARPCALLESHDISLSGASALEKIARVTAQMQADVLLVTEPDALCWLLNIRGADVPYNPLPLAYGVVHRSGDVSLLIDPRKVTSGVLPSQVQVVDEREVVSYFSALEATTVQLDPATCPVWFKTELEANGKVVVQKPNPITLLKAIKNDTEIEGMRRAHLVDGKALGDFIDWFNALPPEAPLSELDVVAELEARRRSHPDYRQPSFATIAGAGEHGAIVHYRATETTNRAVTVGDALLIDSGGQYPYGTTDVTRTLFRGEPGDGFRRHFTLVLKGHIALACAVFPEGTTGHQLDVLARQFLWAEGLDYRHGTGHGVGHYLCVHEGPQSISTRANGVALQPGMILSNEPGYYLEGHYGIRIESLVLVREHAVQEGVKYLCFETLTRVPIEERLINATMLTVQELEWLRRYNHACRAESAL